MAGEEKRHSARVRRRVKVVFEHDPRIGAFTTNLSRGGICVASDYIASVGSEVSAAVQLPSGGQANFEAMVIWTKKVRGNLNQKSSMGLEFVIPPGEDYNRFIDDSLAYGSANTATREGNVAVTGPAFPSVQAPSEPDRRADRRAEVQRPTASGYPAATLAFPAPPIGMSGRIELMVEDGDLAADAPYECGVSPGAAASWCEQAATRCLLDVLPAGATSVGLSSQIRVRHDKPVKSGEKVVVVATVTEALDERTLSLEVRVESRGALIAGGQHIRTLIGRS